MHVAARSVATMPPSELLEDRLLRISDNNRSSTVDQLRRICATGSPGAVLRALGEAALADGAREAQRRPPSESPELTETAWSALIRSAPQPACRSAAKLLALVPLRPNNQQQLFKPVNGSESHGDEAAVPTLLSGEQLVEVSRRWAQASAATDVEHPALPLAQVWAERQCVWIDERESRILPAAFAAGFADLHPQRGPDPMLWPRGQHGASPNVAGDVAMRLAIEIGCATPYEARSNDTVLLPPLTVADVLAMLYPPPLRTAAWRRNRWGRAAAGLRRLERVRAASDPEQRPAIEILSMPEAAPELDDEVLLAINTPTLENGPRLPRDAVRILGRSYGRGLWLMVGAARCWDRLIARKGELPQPVSRRKPTQSMSRLPTVGIDEIVTMCRWPHTDRPGPAAVSRARSSAAATLETLADSGWLTIASERGWHGAHSELVGTKRSAAGVARVAPVRIMPAPWWVRALKDRVAVPPAPQHSR